MKIPRPANGHGPPLLHHGGHHHGGDGFFPRLTPASFIGMTLFVFFAAQSFTTSPFQRRGQAVIATVYEEDTLRGWKGGHIEVSKKSHVYLQPVFWNLTTVNFTANVNAGYEKGLRELRKKNASLASYFQPWISQDLEPWRLQGISKDSLEATTNLYDVCEGDMMRFQVLNGSLWVHHVTERNGGWYPAVQGPQNPSPGTLAAKGRVPYVLLALMETLRLFPGQIPDLDAVLHTSDAPCIKKKWTEEEGGAPLPVFGFQGSSEHFDLPFPDYSFFGNEQQTLQDPWGNPAQGWLNQASVLQRKYENISLIDRLPQAMWRGPTSGPADLDRDFSMRRAFVTCPDRARAEGRPDDATLVSAVKPPVALQDTCDYRYSVHLQAGVYSNKLKHRLACGSVLLAPEPNRWEFFGRALRPGQHYVALGNASASLCSEVEGLVRDMNLMFDSRGRAVLRKSGKLTPTLDRTLDEMAKDKALAKLLWASEFGAVMDPPKPGSGGNYSWGSELAPWEIAANGQDFVAQHLGMEEVLLYVRDALRAYAALQQFKPRPHAKAVCYTGAQLLEQFGMPFEADAKAVAAAYPALARGYDGRCKAAEAIWGKY